MASFRQEPTGPYVNPALRADPADSTTAATAAPHDAPDDVSMFAPKFVFAEHARAILSIVVSGGIVFTGSSDGSVMSCDGRHGASIRGYGNPAHKGAVTAMAAGVVTSPHTSRHVLLTGGRDTMLRAFDVQSGKLISIFRGHSLGVTCVEMINEAIISASEDRTIRLWTIDAVALRDADRVNDGQKPSERRGSTILRGHQGRINALLVQGSTVFSASDDGTVMAWAWRPVKGSPRRIRTYRKHSEAVTCLKIAGSTLLTGSRDHTCRSWDIKSGAQLGLFQTGAPVTAIVCTRQVLFAATASYDTRVHSWDIASGIRVAEFAGHTHSVATILLVNTARGRLSGGPTLVSGGSDRAVRVWNTISGLCTGVLSGHAERVTHLLRGPAGLIYSAGHDGVVRAWRVQNDEFEDDVNEDVSEPEQETQRDSFEQPSELNGDFNPDEIVDSSLQLDDLGEADNFFNRAQRFTTTRSPPKHEQSDEPTGDTSSKKEQNTEAAERVTQLESKVARLQIDQIESVLHESDVRGVEKELDILTVQVERDEGAVRRLALREAQFEQELSIQRRTVAELERKLGESQQALQRTVRKDAKSERHAQRNEEKLTRQVELLKAERATQAEAIERTQAELAEAFDRIRGLTGIAAGAEAMERQLADALAELGTVRAREAALRTRLLEREREWSATLQALQTAALEAQNRVHDADLAKATLEAEVREQTARAERGESQCLQYMEAAASLSEQFSGSQSDLQALVHAKTVANEDLSMQLQIAKNQLLTIEDEMKAIARDRWSAEEELAELRLIIHEQGQGTARALSVEPLSLELQKTVADLQAALAVETARRRELEQQLAATEQSVIQPQGAARARQSLAPLTVATAAKPVLAATNEAVQRAAAAAASSTTSGQMNTPVNDAFLRFAVAASSQSGRSSDEEFVGFVRSVLGTGETPSLPSSMSAAKPTIVAVPARPATPANSADLLPSTTTSAVDATLLSRAVEFEQRSARLAVECQMLRARIEELEQRSRVPDVAAPLLVPLPGKSAEVVALENKVGVLTTETRTLRTQLAQQTETADASAKAAAELLLQQKELGERATSDAALLRSKLSAEILNAEALRADILRHRASIETLEMQVATFERRADKTLGFNVTLPLGAVSREADNDDQTRLLRAHVAKLQSEKDALVANLDAARTTYQTSIAGEIRARQELETQMANYNHELQSRGSSLAQLRDSHVELAGQLSATERLRTEEVATLRQQVDMLRKERAQTDLVVTRLQAENLALAGKTTERTAASAVKATAAVDVESTLRAELSERLRLQSSLEQHNASLTAELAVAQAELRRHEERHRTVDDSARTVQRERGPVDALQRATQERFTVLEQKCSHESSGRLQAEGDLLRARQEAAALRAELDVTKKAHRDATIQVQQQEAAMGATRVEINNLVAALQVDAQHAVEGRRMAEAAVRATQADAAALNAQLRQAHAALNELAAAHANVRSELAEAYRRLEEEARRSGSVQSSHFSLWDTQRWRQTQG